MFNPGFAEESPKFRTVSKVEADSPFHASAIPAFARTNERNWACRFIDLPNVIVVNRRSISVFQRGHRSTLFVKSDVFVKTQVFV